MKVFIVLRNDQIDQVFFNADPAIARVAAEARARELTDLLVAADAWRTKVEHLTEAEAVMRRNAIEHQAEAEKLREALVASERSDAESLAMYRSARDRADRLQREIDEIKQTEFLRRVESSHLQNEN